MKEQLTKMLTWLKEFWGKLTKKMKILIATVAGVVLLAAVAITVVLNVNKSAYIPMYFGTLSESDTSEVYATLQGIEGVNPEVRGGQVLVPREQRDQLVIDLMARGLPKQATDYSLWLNNNSFTMTEADKKSLDSKQLDLILSQMIQNIDGVKFAQVQTAVGAEDRNYVWQDEKSINTASVIVEMEAGYEISAQRVVGIKNLVSKSVLNLEPENVTVIDAKTGLDVEPPDEGFTVDGLTQVEYERKVEEAVVSNVKRLLVPIYGVDGVTVAAKGIFNYETVKREERELIPGENGNGIPTEFHEQYTVGDTIPVEGIVGEQNNTDVPQYPAQNGEEEGGITDYKRDILYDISETLTQTESTTPVLESMTVSVIVDEEDFNGEREEALINLIMKATALDRESVYVTNLLYNEEDAQDAVTQPEGGILSNPRMLLLFAGAALALLLFIFLLLLLFSRGKKKKKQKKGEQVEQMPEPNPLENIQEEIDEHKRQLAEAAEMSNKDNAITNEVREFAKENPEITATLIRSLLKEEEA